MKKLFIGFISAILLTCFVCLASSNAGTIKLPDTGLTKCYRGVSPYDEIPCAGTGQDGEYNINPMNFTDNGGGTVTDNNTGLMWQKCSIGQNNDATCSGTAHNYNWYQASGTYDATYNPGSIDVCGSVVLGGHSDWRLPTRQELLTIIDYSIPYYTSTDLPAINTTYFPNTRARYYWTSNTYAYEQDKAWEVGFHDGGVNYFSKSNDVNVYMRCVRGEQLVASFVDNGNGTVTDNNTGLMWQQGETGTMSWDSALSYCEELSLGDKTDWRLSNVKELDSITDVTRYGPSIDTSFFPNVHWDGYRSSTTYVSQKNGAWVTAFYAGYLGCCAGKEDGLYVRCVRGGQSGSFGNSGDMNGDDLIDISDVILVLRIALKLDPVKPCSDINNNGIVDISDVILTLRMALKLDTLKACI